MELNSQSVAAYKEILLHPSKYGLKHRPLTECFLKSETVTASHILFNEMKEHETPLLPKIFFYIIMEEVYGPANWKDAKGYLGYRLTFKPVPEGHEKP